MNSAAPPSGHAYIYCRWSDGDQTSGDSLARQIGMTSGWCERRGYAVSPERVLIDSGRSAYAGAHLAGGALGRFLTDAQRGRVPKGSILVVEHYDRIARLPLPTVRLLVDTLTAAGIRIGVVALDHILDRESGNTMMGQMLLLIYAEIAHAASAQKSHRQSEAWVRKNKSALKGQFDPTTAPRWISRNGDSWEFNEHASTVALIFHLYRNNYGTHSIANHLNQKNVPTMTKITASGRDMKVGRGGKAERWTSSSVMQILRSRATYGARVPHRAVNELTHEEVVEDGSKITRFKLTRSRPPVGNIIPEVYPAAITREMFDAVQDLIEKRRDGGGNKGRIANVLAGVLFCATCGGRLQRSHARLGYRQDRLYCHGAKMGDCSARGSLLAEPICEAVLDRLAEAHDVISLRHDPARRQLEDHLEAQRVKRTREQGALDALREELSGSLTPGVAAQFAAMADAIHALDRNITETEASLLHLQVEAARPPVEIEELRAAYRGEPGPERDEALRMLNLYIRQVFQSITVVIAGENRGDWLLHVIGGWASARSGDDRWYVRSEFLKAVREDHASRLVAEIGTDGKVVAARVRSRIGPKRLTSRPFPPLSREHAARQLAGVLPPDIAEGMAMSLSLASPVTSG
ncbi:MAG: recombinase family protein [Acetobacteraceae bacterium]|nr:recombinase family protein [Acetobacteraceae bacterium]